MVVLLSSPHSFSSCSVSLLALAETRRARSMNKSARDGAQLPCPVRKAPALGIEVRIEDANLRNAIEWKVIAPCGLSDRFCGGPIVDAIGFLLVLTDIGMDPGDLLLCIVAYD